jgi:hypothetical protein
MALTPNEERERKARIARRESGSTNPRLDYLNRKKTASMTDDELRHYAKKYPGGQAEQELKQRGAD